MKWSVFFSYIKALGYGLTVMLIVSFLLYQAASVMSNVWLSQWTEDPLLKNMSLVETPEYNQKQGMYLGVYGALGGIQGKNPLQKRWKSINKSINRKYLYLFESCSTYI